MSEMQSINYTYDQDQERLAWLIYDREGRVIAEAMDEKSADLIVCSLNGVA